MSLKEQLEKQAEKEQRGLSPQEEGWIAQEAQNESINRGSPAYTRSAVTPVKPKPKIRRWNCPDCEENVNFQGDISSDSNLWLRERIVAHRIEHESSDVLE